MSSEETSRIQNHGQTTIDCDRCGQPRTSQTDRFVVTIEDHSESTAAFDRWLLCKHCFKSEQNRFRREVQR